MKAFRWEDLNCGDMTVVAADLDAAREEAATWVHENYRHVSGAEDLRYDLMCLEREPDGIDETPVVIVDDGR